MDAREKKLQGHRLRITGLTVVNAMAQSAVLGLYAWAGTIPAWVPAAFLIVSAGNAGTFYCVIRCGWNLRLKDKGLLVPQMAASGAIQLAFLLLVPNLAVLFMVVLLVVFGYAAIQFTPRQFMAGWLIYGAATAIALFAVRDRFGFPGSSHAEIAILWLFFFVSLRRLILPSVVVSQLRNQLSEKNHQLGASLARIEELASHDDLTGAYNRRRFMELLQEEIHRADRTGEMFCLAMVDLDHFKAVNDRYGHPAGDAVLKGFCETASQVLRVTDRLGRLGGEEFGVLLTASSRENGQVAMERIRAAVRERDWNAIDPGLKVTYSGGITGYRKGDSPEAMIKRSDEALYQAKHGGRDRIVEAGVVRPDAAICD
jgi:diguanylate cyclase (GGDEF)-like protein